MIRSYLLWEYSATTIFYTSTAHKIFCLNVCVNSETGSEANYAFLARKLGRIANFHFLFLITEFDKCLEWLICSLYLILTASIAQLCIYLLHIYFESSLNHKEVKRG